MSRLLRLSSILGAALFAAPLVAQPLVYVTDPGSNSLTAINSGNNTIIRVVPALTGARALAVSPDGTRVYVAATGTGSNGEVAAIDGTKVADKSQNPVIAEIRVGGKPIAVAYDAQTGLLYVADAKNNQAASYNLGNIDPADPEPRTTYAAHGTLTAMALSPDGETLALASKGPTEIALYNLRAFAAGLSGGSIVSLSSKPQALAFSARGDKLWIATSDGFAAYSTTNGSLTSHTEAGGTTSVAVAPRARRVYFGAGSGHLVYAYAPASSAVSEIATPGPVQGLSVSADGTRLYAVMNCNDCGAAVLSTATGQTIKQVHFGSNPETAGQFAGPGAIYAPNAATAGSIGEQLSATVEASDYDNRGLSYSLLEAPATGTLNFNASGDFAYTPPAGYSGVQSFVWQAAASGGEGAPNDPVSRPVTETLAILPSISAIGDQTADPDSTLGPLSFTIAGSVPFVFTAKSSNSDLVNAQKIELSAGCGTTSLSCSLTVPVKDVTNGATKITIAAVDPGGLVAKTQFKVQVGNGNNDDNGSGSLAPLGLAGLALLALLVVALRRRNRGRV
ncbi:MAG: Ig-like domain-containing protein [Gammaproteobacteria bacterium]